MKIGPAGSSLIQKIYSDRNRTPESGFGRMLKEMVGDVDALQTRASNAAQAAVNGQSVEVHDVMIAMEESRLSFDLMLEIRNKLVDAYNQLMQMRM